MITKANVTDFLKNIIDGAKTLEAGASKISAAIVQWMHKEKVDSR